MRLEPPVFQFRSDLFTVDPQEDQETNPFCYGKSVAEWIKGKFSELGYRPEAPIPEDWGWCVVLKREPFILWVGCGNVTSELLLSVTPEQKASFVPLGSELLWSCMVGADAPIWTKFFWLSLFGRANSEFAVAQATQELQRILSSEPGIRLLSANGKDA